MGRAPQHEARDVPASKLRPLVVELEQRCGGTREASAYSGVSRVTFWSIRHSKREWTEKRTARLIILALYERRKEDRRNGASETFLRARRYQAELEERMRRLAGY